MAYIPPHLRVSDGKSRPRPEPPPPSRREPNSFARGNEKGLVPDVRINYSGDFISRFIVMSQEPLEFERFHGETFAHLDHKELYVLKTRDAKEDDNSTDQENVEKKVKESPSDLIAKTSGEDLKQVLEKFKSFIVMENADRIVPRVAIKFGKVIFHCRGGSLERSGGFLRNAIEAKDGRLRDLSKTFDNSVSEEKYSLLYNIAFRNAEKTWSRERYTVQVSDETNPGKQLLCVCMGAKSNEQLQHCSISSSGSCLKMIKVKFATVRYFICDMACVKKTSDIRLMLCTKNYCTGLNEEELEDLESCFSNVSLIPNVKGGLHWPAGSKQSRSGRFKVLGSTHSEKVVFVGRGLRWSLQKRNRIEFKASSGRVSYEVNIRPTSYDKFCQGPEDMSIEDLLSLILEVIDQAWEQFV